MITVENTENLTGVKISGDFYDFQTLVDAFYAVSIDEEDTKNSKYFDNSTRVLGLCYDIRHAFMGDREIALVDNGMTRELMSFHSQITPEKNVYFEVNYLYPEMIFVTAALNELIDIYQKQYSKPKNEYFAAVNKAVIWDKHIALLRVFQAAFSSCIQETLTPATFTRWLNTMNERYSHVLFMSGHYLDFINLDYLKLDKEQRQKKLSSLSKSIIKYTYDPIHEEMRHEAKVIAEQYGGSPADLVNPALEYPEEIEW